MFTDDHPLIELARAQGFALRFDPQGRLLSMRSKQLELELDPAQRQIRLLRCQQPPEEATAGMLELLLRHILALDAEAFPQGCRCDFCGSWRGEVEYLVEGERSFICASCIERAAQALEEQRVRSDSPPTPQVSGSPTAAGRPSEAPRGSAAQMGDGPRLRCSFCGKTQAQVRKLIAGPLHHICDECITLSAELVRQERGSLDLPRPDGHGASAGETSLRCSFCTMGHDQVAMIIAGPVAHICNECLLLCEEILHESDGTP